MSGKRFLQKSILFEIEKLTILFFLFFLYCGCGQQEAPQKTMDPAVSPGDSMKAVAVVERTDFDTLLINKMQSLVNSDNFSGTVIISAKDGRQISLSTGYADFERQILNSDSSFYQIASLTKIFTALATLDLEQSGKLKFTDSFTKHLKAKLPYNNITIRNLLDHTAGLPDYIEIAGKFWKGESGPNNAEIFQMYRDNKVAVKTPPGKIFAYSNINYIILSSIIEDISGMTFEKYVRELVRDKWTGLPVSGYNEVDDRIVTVAIAYNSTGKKYAKVSESATRMFEKRKGSGGLLITPFEFDKWMSKMFFDLDFYRNILTNKEIQSKVGSSNYVLGWYVTGKKGSEYIYCYGKNPGMNSFCAYLPNKEIIITLFSNTEIDSKIKGEQFVSALHR